MLAAVPNETQNPTTLPNVDNTLVCGMLAYTKDTLERSPSDLGSIVGGCDKNKDKTTPKPKK
jgi:hypothetical protein